MTAEWNDLTGLTKGRGFLVTRVRLKDSGIAVEGEFELPPLARLSYEDQIFVAMFVRSHGSIKQMEQTYGVSYPTVKARLNRISEQLGFVQVEVGPGTEEILAQLERGEITPKNAVKRLKES